MTRTLFTFTCFVAVLSALAALLIRLELARTGVSSLFQTQSGDVDLNAFRTVSAAHVLFGYLAVALMGTTMIAAARERGGLWAGLFMWIGILTGVAMTVILALILMPLPDAFPAWAQYGRTLWDEIAPVVGATPAPESAGRVAGMRHEIVFSTQAAVAMIPAAALVLIGAYSMLSTETGLRWAMILGVIVTIATSVLAVQILTASDLPNAQVIYILPCLPFLAIASLRLTDEVLVWLVVMTLGMIALIAAQIAAAIWNVTLVPDSMARAASQYVLPLGLIWFALPAFILFRSGGRYDTVLGRAMIWLMAPLVTIGVALWAVPIFRTGLAGQPARFADYPEDFASLNLAATVGLGVFILLYLTLLIWVQRTRDGDAP